MEDVATRFFDNPLGEKVGRYMIGKVARAVMGDRAKELNFGLGESNAGKSVLVRAVQLACELELELILALCCGNEEARKR